MSSIEAWLKEIGLERYASVFDDNGVDLESLALLTESDLEKLGVLLGHRRKLLTILAHHSTTSHVSSGQTEFPAAAAIGERRQATVLFSDLSGYTAMNERLDPEAVREIVGQFKVDAVSIVEEHGGVVNQFVGDEVMALFGIPQAHEDDPVRAVRAARDLHAMVRALELKVGPGIGATLRLHSGISTGLVVTGTEDRRDGTYGVTGDAVNTGARLAALAAIDTVLVSEETQRLIADYYQTEALPSANLKGKAGKVTPYRVIEQTGISSRFEAAAQRGFTAYAGRESELRTLQAALAQVLSGRGQFVTVMGEPGIGKSRLIFEFLQGVPRNEIRVLNGQCQSYGTDTSYLPMIDALRNGLGLVEGKSVGLEHDNTVKAVLDISAGLERYIPQYLHLLSIRSSTYVMPADLQGDALRRSFEAALVAAITQIAGLQPLLLILEDWHWADEASDSALKHLCTLLPHHPVQVVVTHRPEYERGWANPQYYTPLVLHPLTERDTAAMLRAVWDAERLPDGLAEQVHARTGGNALFNEEVARALAEAGNIDVTEGRVTLKDPMAELNLPETVHAVIRARVDRLAPEVRDVLRLASVIGREFAVPLLEKLHEEPWRISAALEVLGRQDLVHPLRVVPEPAYLFKHALVQDVVYETLLHSQRKLLHKRAGEAIEKYYENRLEEQYENLANHYEESEVHGKATEYREKAAIKAVSRSSMADARHHWQRLIAMLDRVHESRAEQEMRIRSTLMWAEIGTGFPTPKLAAALERALQCAKSLGMHSEMLAIASWEAHIRTMLGEATRGLALAEFVISEGSPIHGDPAVGRAHTVLGMSSTWSGRPDFAVNHARMGRPSLKMGMGSFWDGYLLIMGGFSAALVGDFNESTRWFSLTREVPITERAIEPWIHVYFGYSLNENASWAQGSGSAQKGSDIARNNNDPWPAAWGLVTDGYARFMSGQHREGITRLGQGVDELQTKGLLYTISWAYALFAEVTLILNDVTRGSELAEASREFLRDGDRIAEPITYRALAMAGALHASVDWPLVFGHLAKATAIASDTGRSPQLAITHFRHAEILHRKIDMPAALAQLRKAAELFAEMEIAWWHDQAAALRERIESGRPFLGFAPNVDGTLDSSISSWATR